jgi:hypothetical protein
VFHVALASRAILLTAIFACVMILPSLALGSTHYVAASGSDSNNGTSKTMPWLHAPGMPSCSSNCRSYTPVPGDQIVFRGGDIWHFGNSSLSPYTGGTWSWTWSGSDGSFIYVGVDPSWYSGTSWTRPILNGDNPTSTSPVASCRYVPASGDQVLLVGRYFVFDNFELVGMCWDGSVRNQNYIHYEGAVPGYQNPMTISSNYLHGWTHTSKGGQSGGSGFSGYNQHYGVTLQYNVIDGSDSDDLSLQWCGQGSDTYILAGNVIRHVGGTCVSNTCHIVHDNLFEHMNNATDGTHTDILFCYGEANQRAGDGTPNLWYNNTFRYIGTDHGVATSAIMLNMPTTGQTDYIFNNVLHDNQPNGGNYWNAGEGATGNLVLFNNTGELGTAGCLICNSRTFGTITSVNNHWITAGGLRSIFGTPSKVTEKNAVYMTPRTASRQGYKPANDYAPTAARSSTVGAGTNDTDRYCSTLQSAGASVDAISACKYGTTDACSYNPETHSVSCPAITAIPRGSTWDVGAYQFSTHAGSAPSPSVQ